MNETTTDQTLRTTARTAARPTRRAARGVVAAGIPLLLAGLLVGCSDDPSADAASGSGSSSDSGSGSGATATGAPGSGASSAAGSTDDRSLLAATSTARDAVGSGTVVSVEQEQGGAAWEVLVVTADGTEHEVHTDASGRTVQGEPVVDDTDADDRAEHQRAVDAADLDVRQAAERFGAVRAGTITELGLDDHLGKVVWEGDVVDTSGARWSVRIDAGSGDVVTDERDTDD